MTEQIVADLNNKVLGSQGFGVVTLADGSKVPTGTVGALMANIKRYNSLNENDHVTRSASIYSLLMNNDDVLIFILRVSRNFHCAATAFYIAKPHKNTSAIK